MISKTEVYEFCCWTCLKFDYYVNLIRLSSGQILRWVVELTSVQVSAADCVEEIDAQQVFGYALFTDGSNARLSYPLEKFHLDVSGRSFHNGRFILRMQEKATSLRKYNSVLKIRTPFCFIYTP